MHTCKNTADIDRAIKERKIFSYFPLKSYKSYPCLGRSKYPEKQSEQFHALVVVAVSIEASLPAELN